MLRPNRTNILLQKDDVGVPKAPCRNLPTFGHTYGLPGTRDKEGVNKLTSVWTSHKADRDQKYERDFTKTNKVSLRGKATTSRA